MTALHLAERQANLLVTAWGGGARAISTSAMQTLLPLDISNETEHRGRFTLAHELKHHLDAQADVAAAYALLTDRQMESVCNHFAACLLMSKRLVYRLWGEGLRTSEALARAAGVSVQAMTIRLHALGLPNNRGAGGRAPCRRQARAARVPTYLVKGRVL